MQHRPAACTQMCSRWCVICVLACGCAARRAGEAHAVPAVQVRELRYELSQAGRRLAAAAEAEGNADTLQQVQGSTAELRAALVSMRALVAQTEARLARLETSGMADSGAVNDSAAALATGGGGEPGSALHISRQMTAPGRL